jgi:hypothetical protein
MAPHFGRNIAGWGGRNRLSVIFTPASVGPMKTLIFFPPRFVSSKNTNLFADPP